ncbi:DNA gyrase subunit A [Candidatus Uhrbacteria bacterium CG_4_9_14_0_2_um_filter_41_50]|uniref:DNA gyrase subunit A n=1 Tax=Candidatus Uhrbacteria bacterium CG_4_9_14_0_2_um_filter_41_50 TaxID=1975031 RepID=A0A2M8EQ58_9BACT|nr:MAG: DNA gyrase subunit A [Candidatus Uhrbacteria bacterium CG_4_10_14_3_um_filter_41_21]PIZ54481.1 MAG: DNA gyrase subunit A [Candidatus Uhrbacteria bacterium CG_4_10_14_0_2_um_filter_41_21]PJB84831.1 MAG: DNA gyrase subunit A [Candidatus Uhrbacteria bacterium CG_4_9_14_0_8_um_filter_41_16]PJC24876.1 MAG: DNA gyrase subunit A [Candidatus Uhrbacteria bacterium CG_4_9_14_0_2_um_filter_41_50]PJE75216.1 MAG: DNA gyrase subunit A [Candidatus Uhrbacteria bacterium CG10_big_fil_rev_8_21_14_0_10_41
MMAKKKETISKDGDAPKSVGMIIEQSITKEMKRAYLDYAMSVIVSRALPDVRDGLKPVQRRILYAMWSIGLRSNAKFRKSANVVGEVMAKYHPHGDSSIYEAMVRMAQDFSYRHPLVRGQGNFGSMDGDSAAAMRYTEAKLQGIAEEMLLDIERETVDFRPNYDGSHKEPSVLPGKLPNLLINGTLGIAVGMATNIPPHNLREIGNAVLTLIDNKDATLEDLLEHVKGPDFPTGAIAYSTKDIKAACATGRGGVVVRAKAEIEEGEKGGNQIVIYEVPYMVNKATLLEKIAALVHEKKLDGIRDLRDESNKDGVRVVIELKKDAYPRKVLNRLYQMTALQTTFHYNMVCLVENGLQPRTLGLKAILEEYIKHRREVVRRRTEFDLARAQDRAHILEGLKIALAKIDKVIATIKKSKDKDVARVNLMKEFKMTERQAIAILEMRLQSLANLEQLKIEQEYKEKMDFIRELESILKSDKKMMGVIRSELVEVIEKYGEDRRTQIVKTGIKEFSMEDVIPDDQTIVMMTKDGYIKRLSPDTFKSQARGGKGVAGVTTKEEDLVESIFSTTTHQDIMFFTSRGRVFKLKVYEIPEASRTAKGQAIVNFLQLASGEKVTATLESRDLAGGKYIMMVTNQGTIKKTELQDFENVRRSGLIAIKLKDGDALEWIRVTSGKDELSLATAGGMAIRFNEKDVRPMGRVASGVRGIKLKGGDLVVGMDVVSESEKKDNQLLVIMENGYGKRTALREYKVQSRAGMGIRTAKITPKTGKIVSASVVGKDDTRDLIVISEAGQVIRLSIKSVSTLGRATQGVRVMRFKKEGDKVSSVAIVEKGAVAEAVEGAE